MIEKQLTVGDYYPAPFWFLNHKLEKDELVRQIGLMKEQNIKAFFLHPRKPDAPENSLYRSESLIINITGFMMSSALTAFPQKIPRDIMIWEWKPQ